MNSEERYVFDTNVIISAILFSTSAPGQAFVGAGTRDDPGFAIIG